jgi:ADP-ribosyl-[dinitrogen reductase] hydrolase
MIDERSSQLEVIQGVIIGTAIGDSLGLPYEGLSPRRAKKLLGSPDRHRFFFGRGFMSDDTEHTCFVAQAWMKSQRNPDRFVQLLAHSLRWWLLCIPAGIGLATLKSIVKLWLGFSPNRSGVFSAGNGPAMRSALLGVLIEDRNQLKEFVRVSTRITHTDPKAEWGAFAVAWAARMSANGLANPKLYLEDLIAQIPEATEFHHFIEEVTRSVGLGQSTAEYAQSKGWNRGISGYVYQTVPIVIHAWLSHPDKYEQAVKSIIECGGDADTTAAIVGAVVGARVGLEGIPKCWIDRFADRPRSIFWMTNLTNKVCGLETTNEKSRWLFCLQLLIRNVCFAFVVLFHGFRRLFPPYR